MGQLEELRHAPADAEQLHLLHLRTRLAEEFPQLSYATVTQCTEQAYRALDEAPIREFVPVLVERRARAACRQLVTTGS